MADQWYSTEDPDLSPDIRKLFEEYSKIPADEVLPHVRAIRDKGWAVHHYPCIGQWRFLELALGQHKQYPEILSRMRSGNEIHLELGCAFGQDIRRLVADGVDSSKCYGLELHQDFIDLGYDLFKDRETLKSEFLDADIFDVNSSLSDLHGKVDVIGASSFFHLFSWDEQKAVAHRVTKLLKPKAGSLLVGRHIGNEVAGESTGGPRERGARFRHDAESWQRLWREVGDEVGVKFQCDTAVKPVDDMALARQGNTWMRFSVRRL